MEYEVTFINAMDGRIISSNLEDLLDKMETNGIPEETLGLQPLQNLRNLMYSNVDHGDIQNKSESPLCSDHQDEQDKSRDYSSSRDEDVHESGEMEDIVKSNKAGKWKRGRHIEKVITKSVNEKLGKRKRVKPKRYLQDDISQSERLVGTVVAQHERESGQMNNDDEDDHYIPETYKKHKLYQQKEKPSLGQNKNELNATKSELRQNQNELSVTKKLELRQNQSEACETETSVKRQNQNEADQTETSVKRQNQSKAGQTKTSVKRQNQSEAGETETSVKRQNQNEAGQTETSVKRQNQSEAGDTKTSVKQKDQSEARATVNKYYNHCLICDDNEVTFTKVSGLWDHILKQHIQYLQGKCILPCPYCQRQVTSKGASAESLRSCVRRLVSHLNNKHGLVFDKDGKHTQSSRTMYNMCLFCNNDAQEKFGNQADFQYHVIETHLAAEAGNKSISCPFCSKYFMCKGEKSAVIKQLVSRLFSHFVEKHGLVFDGHTSGNSRHIQPKVTPSLAHVASSYVCIFCGENTRFARKAMLVEHVREHHLEYTTHGVNIKCPKCMRSYPSKGMCWETVRSLVRRFLEHISVDHQIAYMSGISNKTTEKQNDITLFNTCVLCKEKSKPFLKLSALEEHIKRSHVTETNHQHLVKCDFCFKAYASEMSDDLIVQRLLAHVRREHKLKFSATNSEDCDKRIHGLKIANVDAMNVELIDEKVENEKEEEERLVGEEEEILVEMSDEEEVVAECGLKWPCLFCDQTSVILDSSKQLEDHITTEHVTVISSAEGVSQVKCVKCMWCQESTKFQNKSISSLVKTLIRHQVLSHGLLYRYNSMMRASPGGRLDTGVPPIGVLEIMAPPTRGWETVAPTQGLEIMALPTGGIETVAPTGGLVIMTPTVGFETVGPAKGRLEPVFLSSGGSGTVLPPSEILKVVIPGNPHCEQTETVAPPSRGLETTVPSSEEFETVVAPVGGFAGYGSDEAQEHCMPPDVEIMHLKGEASPSQTLDEASHADMLSGCVSCEQSQIFATQPQKRRIADTSGAQRNRSDLADNRTQMVQNQDAHYIHSKHFGIETVAPSSDRLCLEGLENAITTDIMLSQQLQFPSNDQQQIQGPSPMTQSSLSQMFTHQSMYHVIRGADGHLVSSTTMHHHIVGGDPVQPTGGAIIHRQAINGSTAQCKTTPGVRMIPHRPIDCSSVPHQTRDGSSVPHQTIDGSSVPHQTRDGSSVPHQTRDGSSVPHQTIDGSSVPLKPIDGSSVPHQTIDGSSVPHQTIDGSSVPQRPIDGSSVPQRPIDGSNVPHQTRDGSGVPHQRIDGSIVPQRPIDGSSAPHQTRDGSSVPHQTRDGSSVPHQRIDGSSVPQRPIDGSSVPHQTRDGSGVPHQTIDGSSVPHKTRDGSSVPHKTRDGSSVPHQIRDGSSVPHQTIDGSNVPHPLIDGNVIIPQRPTGGGSFQYQVSDSSALMSSQSVGGSIVHPFSGGNTIHELNMLQSQPGADILGIHPVDNSATHYQSLGGSTTEHQPIGGSGVLRQPAGGSTIHSQPVGGASRKQSERGVIDHHGTLRATHTLPAVCPVQHSPGSTTTPLQFIKCKSGIQKLLTDGVVPHQQTVRVNTVHSPPVDTVAKHQPTIQNIQITQMSASHKLAGDSFTQRGDIPVELQQTVPKVAIMYQTPGGTMAHSQSDILLTHGITYSQSSTSHPGNTVTSIPSAFRVNTTPGSNSCTQDGTTVQQNVVLVPMNRPSVTQAETAANPIINSFAKQTISNNTKQQTVGGSTHQQIVDGSTNQQSVGGSTNQQIVGGSTNPQTRGGSKNQQTLGGSTNQQIVGGMTNQQTLGGSTNQQTLGGSKNQQIIGSSTISQTVGGSTISQNVGCSKFSQTVGGSTISQNVGGSKISQTVGGSTSQQTVVDNSNQQAENKGDFSGLDSVTMATAIAMATLGEEALFETSDSNITKCINVSNSTDDISETKEATLYCFLCMEKVMFENIESYHKHFNMKHSVEHANMEEGNDTLIDTEDGKCTRMNVEEGKGTRIHTVHGKGTGVHTEEGKGSGVYMKKTKDVREDRKQGIDASLDADMEQRKVALETGSAVLKCPICDNKFMPKDNHNTVEYLLSHMVRKHGYAVPTYAQVYR